MKTIDLAGVRDEELSRWIRRLVQLLVIAAIAFTAFYVIDRWRPASTPIVDQQIAKLEQAVRDNPNEIAKRGQLADAYLAKSRFADALTQYEVIIGTGQDLYPAQYGKARALVGLDRLDEAIKAYDEVVRIGITGEMAVVDPTLEAAYYGLGEIALKQGRAADAVTNLEKAVALKRSDADALYLLGTAYTAAGQQDKAIAVLRSAIAFVPIGWGEPYTALASAYTAAGKTALATWATAMADLSAGRSDQAATALKTITSGDAALDAAIGLGVVYESRGDLATAAEWYGKALAIAPDSDEARLGLNRTGAQASAGGKG